MHSVLGAYPYFTRMAGSMPRLPSLIDLDDDEGTTALMRAICPTCVICLLESGSGEIANSSSSSNVVVVPVVADASSGNSAQDE